jgi:SAM-dependent methyltransferase
VTPPIGPRREGIRTRIDRAVRASWIGRRAGWLRGRFPRVYVRIRGIYDRATSNRHQSVLSASQSRAVERFLATTPAELLRVGVLEIGSDLEGHVLRAMLERRVARVVGINPAIAVADAERITRALPTSSALQTADLRDASLPSASFGAVFSVAVFEHLLEFDACLAEMHRLLVPGGRVYAAFGPIWSSSLGHHVFAEVDGEQLRHWDPSRNPVDDHAHLLLPESGLREQIAARRGPALADAAVQWILRGSDLNRLYFEDYVAAFERSRFRLVSLIPDKEHLAARRGAALRAAHPGRTVFDIRNAEVILERPR